MKPEVDMRPPSWNRNFLVFDHVHPLPSLIPTLVRNLKFLAQMVQKLCQKTKPEVDMRPPSLNRKFLIFDNIHQFPLIITYFGGKFEVSMSNGSKDMAKKRNRK